jgi:nucleoid-associated protein YgaU
MLDDIKERLNLQENYVSMGLGLIVVLVVGTLIFNAVTGRSDRGSLSNGAESTELDEATESALMTDLPAKYVVGEGEDLWTISEKFYGSGYNWEDIVKANNITNPDMVEGGTELTIPDVSPKPTPSKVKFEEYTVKPGETLFEIAVKVYGDGFAYAKIAKANNLRNVNKIESGQKLIIPRQ